MGVELEVLWRLCGTVSRRSARSALAVADTALERALSGGGLDPGSPEYAFYVRLLGSRIAAQRLLGRLESAAADAKRALELARADGSMPLLFSHCNSCDVDVARGDRDAALLNARRAVELAGRVDVPIASVFACSALGEAHLLSREFAQALDPLEQALALSRDQRVGGMLEGQHLAGLAEAHLGLGEVERARQSAQRAVEQGKGHAAVRGRLSLARTLMVAPGGEAAAEIESLLDEASDEIERGDWLLYVPQVHVERAALARLRGDGEARLQHLREAQRLFSEMGATGHAERVARELSEAGQVRSRS